MTAQYDIFDMPKKQKQEMSQAGLYDNFLEQPTAHKKKAHAAGEGQAITIEGIRIDFPLKPYAAQIQMMTRIIHALNNEENALLESPTGSGKSLALLCAALAWRENQEKKKAAEILQRGAVEKRPTPDDTEAPQVPIKKVKTRMVSPPSFCSDEDFQPPVKRFIAELVDQNTPQELPSSSSASMDDVQRMKYQTYKEVPRIFVGSRTHKQIAQLIGELKSNTRYNPRTTILGSRDQLCIHPKVSKSNNKTDDCTTLLDENKCSFSHNTKKILGHPSLKTTERIWDIEDMVRLGKKVRGCPYYAARKLYEGAEVIFCPYNYIIDPVIRNILDIQLKDSIVILDEAHNIEDASRSAGSIDIDETSLEVLVKELKLVERFGGEKEAHALMVTIIYDLFEAVKSEDIQYTKKEYERHSCHFTGVKLLDKLDQMNINKNTFASMILPAYKKISSHAEEVRKAKESIATSADDYAMEEIDGLSSQVQVQGTRAVSNGSLTILQGLITVLTFIFDPEQSNAKDYQMVFMKQMTRPMGSGNFRRRKNQGQPQSLWVHKIGFWLQNPAVIFKNMCKETRSVILTSGTLSPLNTFASELGVKFNGRLEANHVIKPSQVWVTSIPQGPNRIPLKCVYTNIEHLGFQDEVGETLCNIIDRVPYGVLVFMPSYKALDTFTDRWKITGVMDRLREKKLVLSEPKGSDKKEFENVLNTFYDQIDNVEANIDQENRDGALFFAVFRGKVSEGIDFSDNYCRAVVTLGIPYPGFKDLEVNLKKDYNNRMKNQIGGKDLLSGHEWYEAQAYRAINQALGRCIRHKNDWGAIILLEERFNNRNVVNGLSKWVKGQVRQSNHYESSMEELVEFIARQTEEDKKKAAERREQIRLQEEADEKLRLEKEEADRLQQAANDQLRLQQAAENFRIKSEIATANAADAMVIHSSQSFEYEQENGISLEKTQQLDASIVNEVQPFTPSWSKYFSHNSQQEPLHSLENITPAHQGLFVSTSEIEPNGLTNANNHPNSNDNPIEIDMSSPTFNDTELENSPVDNNFRDIMPPPELPFVKAEYRREHKYHETSSSSADVTHFSCPNCAANLLQGLEENFALVEVHDLEIVKAATGNKCVVKEIQLPDMWNTSSQLLGGPLDIHALTSRTAVIYDRTDDVCVRTLVCACNVSFELGVVVCAATNPAKSHHVGKVYLWGFRDTETESIIKPLYNTNNMHITAEDMNMEIPNSQYSSANDIFYNL